MGRSRTRISYIPSASEAEWLRRRGVGAVSPWNMAIARSRASIARSARRLSASRKRPHCLQVSDCVLVGHNGNHFPLYVVCCVVKRDFFNAMVSFGRVFRALVVFLATILVYKLVTVNGCGCLNRHLRFTTNFFQLCSNGYGTLGAFSALVVTILLHKWVTVNMFGA